MTPSLFRLFSRSRYRTVAPYDGDGAAETETRSERERFATAAVAFCFKHSSAFRQQFWTTICRDEGDPSEAPELEVSLEPPAWADLRLIAETPKRTVWVVEFKLDSELADKQNPAEWSSFSNSLQGYGALFARSEGPGSDLRFVVLGSRKLPAGSGTTPDLGIRWQARRWRDLTENVPTDDSLTADLIDSLGQLGVSAFRMKEINNIAVGGNFQTTADAWDVLTALGSQDQCGFRSSYWKLAVESPASKHFNVGAYLKPPPVEKTSSGVHKRLAQSIGGVSDCLAWVGYETGEAVQGLRRSIWFYCTALEKADSLRQGLVDHATTSAPFGERGGMCVVATIIPGDTTKDLEWFSLVLHAACQ